MPFDEEKVRAFAAKMFVDLGGASSVALALAGDRLGLWKGMAGAGPLTPADLAARTSTAERYVREWLCAMAAAEYVTYDAASGRFTLPDEHVPVLADESTPATVLGGLQSISVFFKDEAKLVDAFRSGKGVAWGDHHPDLFQGTERFFRPGYQAHLVAEWIPALDGVEAKLRARRAGRGRGVRSRRDDAAHGEGLSRGPRSSGSTSTRRRSSARAGWRPRRGSPTACPSRWRPPRRSRAPATTWCRSSTACTTWAIRWVPRRTSARRSLRTGRGCSSSRSRTTGSRTT